MINIVKELNEFEMMKLTENNVITAKPSITEKKEQYVQTINDLKLMKALQKGIKV